MEQQRQCKQRNATGRGFGGLIGRKSRITTTILTCFVMTTIVSNVLAQTCKYGIYSTVETNIRDRVQITPGIIGSNTKVEIGVEAKINGDIVSAGTIFLRDRCVVNASVWAGGSITKQNQVTVTGTQQANLGLTTENFETKTVAVDTQNFNLYNGTSLTLAPGTYKDMHLYDGATLNLVDGVYNFNSFIMEAGRATLNYAPGSGFIEINVKGTLRFGDRNLFVLADDADPVQVQFYTNGTSQVKVGTDSIFNGVITAPNAQVYVFSRCTVNGALYGKSVWVDTDSKINLYPNCTAYNSDMDNSETLAMCDALSFEELDWIPVGGGSSTDATLSTMNVSDGDTALQVSLFTDSYVDLEAGVNISMPFSEGATSVTASLDVFSPNAAPYSGWSGEIALYLMPEGGTSYELAGTMIYSPEDIYSDDFTTLQIALSPTHSQLLLSGTASAMLSVSASQDNAVFYLDRLQFCDNNGACNLSCPHISIPGEDMETADSLIDVRWENIDEDNASTDADFLTIRLRNLQSVAYDLALSLQIETPFAGNTSLSFGTVVLGGVSDHLVPVSTEVLPSTAAGAWNRLKFHVTTLSDDGSTNQNSRSTTLYYATAEDDAGVIVLSESGFSEIRNGTLFELPPGASPAQFDHDEEGESVGWTVKISDEASSLTIPDMVDTDANATDTDTGVEIIIE